MVWVGYSHQLKTESRLLAQRELCVFLSIHVPPRKLQRKTDLSVMLALGESLSLTVLNGGHLEALQLLVYA